MHRPLNGREGTPDYKIEEPKTDRGTDIILYIDDEHKEFQRRKIESLLKNVACLSPLFWQKRNGKTGSMSKQMKTTLLTILTLWKRKPSELIDEDYLNFYHELYPMTLMSLCFDSSQRGLPVSSDGNFVLSAHKSNIDLQKNKIQLYCTVFVTDSVEGIVPEFNFASWRHDSPDIPLNVSVPICRVIKCKENIQPHYQKLLTSWKKSSKRSRSI